MTRRAIPAGPSRARHGTPGRSPRGLVRAVLREGRVGLLGAALVAGTVPASACGGKKRGATMEVEAPTTIRVRNQGFLDVNVYAVRSGQRIRIGTVTGNSTQVLRIPAFLMNGGVTPLRFLADPIGSGRTPVSEEIIVTPGDEVVLMIPPM